MMRASFSLLFILSLTATCMADDRDGDGLDDLQVEQMLLDRHRPTLVFEPGERYKPVAILDLVQHSGMFWYFYPTPCGMFSGASSWTVAQIAEDPMRVFRVREGYEVNHPGAISCLGPESSFVVSPNPAIHCRLNIDDAYRAPNSSIPQFFNGIYGHVTPYEGEHCEGGCILVQYWLLFPMNEAECNDDCGDHEGDWLYLDVYVNGSPPYTMQSIDYHHHGDNNCPPVTLPWNGGPLSWYPGMIDLPPTDPDGGRHPICYLEGQAHEWWPWASGGSECEFAPFVCENASHLGGGITYTVQTVINVGEWYAPMPGSVETQIFVLYNGLWGNWASECWTPKDPGGHAFSPPASPMLQFFPTPPSWRFLSHGEPAGVSGSGTTTDPWRIFADAMEQIEAEKTLRIISGTYSAAGTWDNPVTLTATLGPVTLGP